MVICNLSDGLGNQMFQYAYAKYLSYKTGDDKILLNTYKFRNNKFRSFSLGACNLPKNVVVQKGLVNLLSFYKGVLKFKVLTKIRKSDPTDYETWAKSGVFYCRDIYGYTPYCGINKKEKFVKGFFQSAEYLPEIKINLQKELKIKTPPSARNAEMIEKIKKCNSVCLHIRRGDYLNEEWKNLQVCDYKYYVKAITKICEKVENPKFFVFSNTSDDIRWIKENYNFGDINIEYVELNNPDYEEIRLMYTCKHFVLSNSTFSWWAQYLSENENKCVVAPFVWNRNKKDVDEAIYLDSWELIEV